MTKAANLEHFWTLCWEFFDVFQSKEMRTGPSLIEVSEFNAANTFPLIVEKVAKLQDQITQQTIIIIMASRFCWLSFIASMPTNQLWVLVDQARVHI